MVLKLLVGTPNPSLVIIKVINVNEDHIGMVLKFEAEKKDIFILDTV